MAEYFLSEINIYPVKSLGGIRISEAQVTDRGLKYDRRWMLVDSSGKFLTQRTAPQLALIKLSMDNHLIRFEHKLKKDLNFSSPIEIYNDEQTEVVVWDDVVAGNFVNTEIDQWLSDALEIKCRLIHMADNSKRFVNKKYARNNELVSFADGYPFLLIGESSLEDLNSRLKDKIPMNRFRPNFVISGGAPFDEDKMAGFEINGIKFFSVKPCSRCVMITVDQDTGVASKEPLATLSQYRTQNNKVMFGQNLIHEGSGIVKHGAPLVSIDWK